MSRLYLNISTRLGPRTIVAEGLSEQDANEMALAVNGAIGSRDDGVFGHAVVTPDKPRRSYNNFRKHQLAARKRKRKAPLAKGGDGVVSLAERKARAK